MWKRSLSIILFLVLFSQVCLLPVFSLELTDEETEAILKEAELIRGELNALKINLTMLEKVSSWQKERLVKLEEKLKKALQSLEMSEADLIQSKKELELVKTELQTLKEDIIELNKLYLKQRRKKIIWMTTAISLGLAFNLQRGKKMNDISTIAQVVGFLVQAVGLTTVAVRTGSWKGNLENRVDALEKQASQTVQELSAVDKRVDGIEKELLKIMVGVQKDIEYIKKTIDKGKVPPNA